MEARTTAPPTPAVKLPGPPELIPGRPDAVVDLQTDDGADLVAATWRYSDASVEEIEFVELGSPEDPLGPGTVPNRTYDVVAIQMTIWFNVEGDHDHNGLIYVLRRNLPLVKYLRELAKAAPDQAELDRLRGPAQAIAAEFQVPFPTTGADAKKPHEFVRPLVLRAHLGDVVTVLARRRPSSSE